ncbi:MAG TPA: RNA-binding domain-containing protein [Nitrospirota bacterium]|nr:RNA-binding domain-containing protein [Nitrospirota bacterium]
MSIERVRRLLRQRENIHLEFKEAKAELPETLFETICAMLNRDGGDILLGVADNGVVKGVDPSKVEILKANLVNLSNNAQKLDPPFILFPLVHEIDGKTIIHIQVPASSQVHKTGNTVYDRSSEGDFRLTQPHRIAELFNRKRVHYTECAIYPFLRFEDFKQDLFPKIRNLIRSNNYNHPWLTLNDEQILQKAGLRRHDTEIGKEGYTLAAALLLGKDEVIKSILPHYKIDALVRRVNTDRYDDRDYIDTNLIDAYDRLMDFTVKHLPDKFYMEGDQRVSLRAKIFREVVANLIVHREYTSGLAATFIIYKDRVETGNASNPHGEGPISLDNFTPFSKNPLICKFFTQLGRVDELGSGVLNVNKYLPVYAPGKRPQFIEGNSFKMIIPLDETMSTKVTVSGGTVSDIVNDTVSDTVSDTVKERMSKIIIILEQNPGLRSKELSEKTGVTPVTIRRDMQKMQSVGLVVFKGSPKVGGYYLSDAIRTKLVEYGKEKS